MNFDSKKIIKYIKENQKLIAMALVGILLLLLSYTPKNNKKTEKIACETKENISDYKNENEEKVKELMLAVDGIESVNVMITYESGAEKVVLRDTPYEVSKSSESGKDVKKEENINKYSENTVIFNSGSDTVPYVLKEKEPVVSAVAVVYKGNISEEIKYNLTLMIQALFDLEIHKISIIGT